MTNRPRLSQAVDVIAIVAFRSPAMVSSCRGHLEGEHVESRARRRLTRLHDSSDHQVSSSLTRRGPR
jgi:hypothetical protein